LAAAAAIAALSACSVDPFREGTFTATHVVREGSGIAIAGDDGLKLSVEDSSVVLTIGCNSIGGTYELRDGKLIVTEVASTTAGCPPAIAEQEEWLMDFLDSDPRWELVDTTLTLARGDSTITLEKQ
jgi:heat shock protein HslJ